MFSLLLLLLLRHAHAHLAALSSASAAHRTRIVSRVLNSPDVPRCYFFVCVCVCASVYLCTRFLDEDHHSMMQSDVLLFENSSFSTSAARSRKPMPRLDTLSRTLACMRSFSLFSRIRICIHSAAAILARERERISTRALKFYRTPGR